MTERIKAVFIDHSFHRLTRSNDFIKEWLSADYCLSEFLDDEWQGGSPPDIGKITEPGCTNFFFWQSMPAWKKSRKVRVEKLVWFPMEGILAGRHRLKLLGLMGLPLKTVCFSKQTCRALRRYGFDCFYLRFFFRPESLPGKEGYHNPPRILFWQRNQDINWNKVRTIIGGNLREKIILRRAPDPGQDAFPPAAEEVADFRLELEVGYTAIDEYRRKLSGCDIFFAPRRMEGIGMSFLEAMAMGLCVVAPDGPTMNEYICHGVNGFLYDPDAPREIDLRSYQTVGQEAKKDAAEGYRRMEARRRELMRFLKDGYGRRTLSGYLKGFFLLFFDFLRDISSRAFRC